jgi:hypothetical protein
MGLWAIVGTVCGLLVGFLIGCWATITDGRTVDNGAQNAPCFFSPDNTLLVHLVARIAERGRTELAQNGAKISRRNYQVNELDGNEYQAGSVEKLCKANMHYEIKAICRMM